MIQIVAEFRYEKSLLGLTKSFKFGFYGKSSENVYAKNIQMDKY